MMTLDELLYTANQRAIKLEAELTSARAETTRVLSELVACQDQRAALRIHLELANSRHNACNDALNMAEDERDVARAEATALRDKLDATCAELRKISDQAVSARLDRAEARAEADELRTEIERLRQGLEDIGLGDYAADPEWKARELIGMNDN
jgi:predicted  nucleic acid-binding Zn-ribbon protein